VKVDKELSLLQCRGSPPVVVGTYLVGDRKYLYKRLLNLNMCFDLDESLNSTILYISPKSNSQKLLM